MGVNPEQTERSAMGKSSRYPAPGADGAAVIAADDSEVFAFFDDSLCRAG